MYAIAFDFDTELLEQLYPNSSSRNAYADVRTFLEENGFEHRQVSVYFGEPNLTATECIAIVEDMADEFSWFTPSLKDIRMLRIEENNDLMVVLDRKRRRARRRSRTGN
ncbi:MULTISPECIES: virulence factor [unclassified Aureimonas]|uniref:virulence factor n=1 Tax=unclassified Aureimonas TaxID=2615206 RepID=UPI0006F61CA6|nr:MULTISPECIES: virulence factor [unclassified Aureimonas]KQT66016.1 virulence factor [Aureimonas sp. Leaf427]KQT73374.1 virulence factor [Aureimonas sp. Leaf460]